MVLTVLKGLGKAYLKSKAGKTISSVPPNVPKTNIEKTIRDLKISKQKMKAQMAGLQADVFHGTQKIKKALDKIKKPKKKETQ